MTSIDDQSKNMAFHIGSYSAPTYELPLKVQTSSFDSFIPISLWGTLVRRYEDVFC